MCVCLCVAEIESKNTSLCVLLLACTPFAIKSESFGSKSEREFAGSNWTGSIKLWPRAFRCSCQDFDKKM